MDSMTVSSLVFHILVFVDVLLIRFYLGNLDIPLV